MEKKIYQCCYTKLDSGWTFIGKTEDMPMDMMTLAERIQRDHSTLYVNGKTFVSEEFLKTAPSQMLTQLMETKQTVFKLYELAGDGKNVCFNGTVYGASKDKVNRENIFAHAFIMRWDDIDEMDPNGFLTIDTGSFLESPGALEQQKPVVCTDEWTIETAMARAGLNMDSYCQLMKTVVFQLKVCYKREPFYLTFDGSLEQFKAYMYCIYYGLPYALRRILRTATAVASKANNGLRDIIFTVSAQEKRYVVDTAKGINSVLTPAAEKQLPEYFLYALNEVPLADWPAYYACLRNQAVLLGVEKAAAGKEENYTHLAYLQLRYPTPAEIPAEALQAVFDACAAVPYAENEAAGAYVAQMLEAMCTHEVMMSDGAHEIYAKQEDRVQNPALAEAVRRYDVFRFSRIPVREAVLQLGKPGMYEKYAADLLQTSNGKTILEEYYVDLVSSGRYDIPGLMRELDNIAFMPENGRIVDTIEKIAFEICTQSMHTRNTVQQLHKIRIRIDEYSQLLNKIQGEGSYASLNGTRTLLNRFWETMSYADVVIAAEALKLYESLIPKCTIVDINDGENGQKAADTAELFIDFVLFASQIVKMDINRTGRQFYEFFHNYPFGSDKEKAVAVEKLLAHYRETNQYFREDQADLLRLLANTAMEQDTADHLLAFADMLDYALQQHRLPAQDMLLTLQELVEYGGTPALYSYIIGKLRDLENSNEGYPKEELLCVPLDVWLVISLARCREMGGNPFTILEELDAEVLREHPDNVAEESEYLFRADVMKAARDYVAAGAMRSKIIKDWCSACDKMMKKSRKADMKAVQLQEKEAKRTAKEQAKQIKANEKMTEAASADKKKDKPIFKIGGKTEDAFPKWNFRKK